MKSSSQDYDIKLVESMLRRCQAIINNGGDWTINNKASQFISCSMCVIFFNALSQIVFRFRRTRFCQTNCTYLILALTILYLSNNNVAIIVCLSSIFDFFKRITN